MSKQALIDRVRVAEDEAREVRHKLKTREVYIGPEDLRALSSAVIHGLQAVAEALDAITTSGFKT